MSHSHGNGSPSPELLAAYFDGEFEGRDDLAPHKRRIEKWLASHPGAQEEFAEYRRLLKSWQETAPAEPEPAQWSALLSRIEDRLGPDISRREARKRWPFGAALTLAATAACVAVLVLGLPTPQAPPAVVPTTPVVARVPHDEDEVLPVAAAREVAIIRVEGDDTQTLVVGELPVQGVLELAAPGDVILTKIQPDASDNMVPQVQMNESTRPLIWAKLDSELD